MKLGLSMNGLEKEIGSIFTDAMSKFDEITYMEIGVAAGGTLISLGKFMKQLAGKEKRWRAIGVDLPSGYSLDTRGVQMNAIHEHLDLEWVHSLPAMCPVQPQWNTVTVYLMNSQMFVPHFWQHPIHIALIDGCHGLPCVTKDFEAVAPRIVSGGTIMLHDFGVTAHQPHCPGGCDVHGAMRDLGLLDDTREGWKFTGIIKADSGNSDMAVVQRK